MFEHFRWQGGLGSPGKPTESILFNLVSTAVSVLTIGAILLWSGSALQLAVVAFLCVITFFLMVRYLRQERWLRYASSQRTAMEAYAHLSDALLSLVNGDHLGEARQGVEAALRSISKTFSLVTGSNCRVCIVTAMAPADDQSMSIDDLRARVWMRDFSENNRPEKEVPISKNTDFLNVYLENKTFFSNDLVKLFKKGLYKNSNWPEKGLDPGRVSYRATIVAPIKLDSHRVPVGTGSGFVREVAFLCIDTLKVEAFRKPDVPMAEAFAWSLFPVLRNLLTPQPDEHATGGPR